MADMWNWFLPYASNRNKAHAIDYICEFIFACIILNSFSFSLSRSSSYFFSFLFTFHFAFPGVNCWIQTNPIFSVICCCCCCCLGILYKIDWKIWAHSTKNSRLKQTMNTLNILHANIHTHTPNADQYFEIGNHLYVWAAI